MALEQSTNKSRNRVMYCPSCGKSVAIDTAPCPSCGAGAANNATAAHKRSGTSTFAIIAIVVGVLVVPIIGILAAIALPAYQDYQTRAYVSEGLIAATGAKQAVSEFAIARNRFPSSSADVGFPGYSSQRVSNIQVGAFGIVQISYAAPPDVAGKTIILTPSGMGESLQWDCKAGTVDKRYRPNQCR